MSQKLWTPWLAGLLVASFSLGAALPVARADDKPDPAADAAKADEAQEGEKKEEKDPYAVPEGASVEELMKFIEEVKAYRPTMISTREQALANFRSQNAAIIAASDKILEAKPSDEIAIEALRGKMGSLFNLTRIGDSGARKQLSQLASDLRDDKRAKVASDARVYSVALRLQDISADKPEVGKELVAEVNGMLGQEGMDERLPNLAMGVARMIEQSGQAEMAKQAYTQFIETLSKSKDDNASQFVAHMEGALRKLNMIGNPLEIEGTLVNGDKFDWAAYKGKVVLVDFWATWCGPCIAELPNVKKTYEAFHDKGFDVVGISLDNFADKANLEKFLVDEKIAWPILFGTSEEASGWKHPLVARYGIDGIPAAILVDREGNVVTLSARGEQLPKLVEELLAKPAEK